MQVAARTGAWAGGAREDIVDVLNDVAAGDVVTQVVKITDNLFNRCATRSSITSLTAPNVKVVYASCCAELRNCREINFPALEEIAGGWAFLYLGADSVSLPLCRTIATQAFDYCANMTSFSAPNATVLGGNYAIGRSYKCGSVTLGRLTSVANNALRDLGTNLPAVDGIKCSITVGNTCSELMGLSGFPWNTNETTRFVCADGVVRYDGSEWVAILGGGYKCLIARRSPARSWRSPARFYARYTSLRWEVAA